MDSFTDYAVFLKVTIKVVLNFIVRYSKVHRMFERKREVLIV